MKPFTHPYPYRLAIVSLLLPVAGAFAQEVTEVEAVNVTPPVEMAITVEMPELEAAMAEEQAAADALVALQDEVAGLRADLSQLQETLDLLLNQIMADLESENHDLRDEVRRMYQRNEAGIATNRNVPRPGGALVDQVLGEAGMEGETDFTADTMATPVEIPFMVINEWGRSPEVVADLPGDVPTLAGVVGAVPAGSRRVDIEQLGIDLRAKYAAYDNINIEVFNDQDAAAFYAETNVADPVHRVLSISKHAASGRDVILLIQGDTSTEVPF